MKEKCHVFLVNFEDDTLGHIYGADITIYDETASINDFLSSLDEFAYTNLEECGECNGCCYERAPIISPDIPALSSLLPASELPITKVCDAFANIQTDKNGITDITLKRSIDNACIFLDKAARRCGNHTKRPFVCRSHFCLPRSPRLEKLREELINAGENDLTSLILAEEAFFATGIESKLSSLINPDDYEQGPRLGCRDYSEIIIKDIISQKLWQQLFFLD